MDREDCRDIGPMINQALWLARTSLSAAASAHRVSVPQAIALVAIRRACDDGQRIGPADLAARLGQERSAVSVVLAKLVRMRLVVAHTSEEDRRHKTIELTDKGLSVASEMDEMIRDVWCDALSVADDAEAEVFLRVLRRMVESLRSRGSA